MKPTSRKKSQPGNNLPVIAAGYDDVLTGVVDLLESARRTSARAVNAIMTAAYWEIGRRIVECEQGGKEQAEYGETLVVRLAGDLTQRFGRGFGKSNLYQMRSFYLAYQEIFQTLSGKSDHVAAVDSTGKILQTLSGKSAQTPSAQSDLLLCSAGSLSAVNCEAVRLQGRGALDIGAFDGILLQGEHHCKPFAG